MRERGGGSDKQLIGGRVSPAAEELLQHLAEQWLIRCGPGEQCHRGAQLHRVHGAEHLHGRGILDGEDGLAALPEPGSEHRMAQVVASFL